ncbi:cytidylyltransferase domain-containing protein [Hymenobacter psychrophilus]|uniref:Spore coat polysaccharide biosynthesis protein SpsF n=1 Tax=Hymenobacter psychrophilus TaxID=651662 RepID=A0A1H3DM95_9BACT|nr:glycosyltransferase family protein [Hymenobacter psychrophilus]SDX67477.1 spore coat polysaccharide biosynthesis protein SpsF [Hymenobacter psychrophilus]
MKKFGIISQARMTSTRLPGKVLKLIGGRPLLDYHVARLQASGLPLYLATTTNATDDPLAAFGAAHQLPVWRGPEDDVLARYQQCAAAHALDVIVRVTSDCPLLDGELIAQAVQQYLAADNPRLYLSNVLERTYPRGFDFEVFSRELLEEAFHHATTVSDREHVTPYIHQNRSGRVQFQHVTRPTDRSAYRLTVDTAEDFELIRRLLEEHQADALGAEELIALLEKHPELVAINAHIEQKKE